jgi:hypothetical protein
MEIVNGYLCMNCCDVDKARLGQDPHQQTDQLQKQLKKHLDKLAAGNFGPSVTLGGSLQSGDSGNSAASKTNNNGSNASAGNAASSGTSQGLGTGSTNTAPTSINLIT